MENMEPGVNGKYPLFLSPELLSLLPVAVSVLILVAVDPLCLQLYSEYCLQHSLVLLNLVDVGYFLCCRLCCKVIPSPWKGKLLAEHHYRSCE